MGGGLSSCIRIVAFLCLIFCFKGVKSESYAQEIKATDFVDLTPDTDTKTQLDLKTVAPGARFYAQGADELIVGEVPLSLTQAERLRLDAEFDAEDEDMPFDIRKEAIRESAISYGARAGLAWRTYYIRREMDRRGRALDKIYDFRQLLIPAPSGLLIEPPVISENVNAMLIEGDGQQAAVSDRIYNIMNTAKIVAAPRTWRTYLERHWGKVSPPPNVLRPKNREERALWVRLVRKGWTEGVKQADEIFEQDLNRLVGDFEGMIRYRMLLAQGMVSAPYALQVDRGVTGGGDEMRIGDRAVQITGKPSLITGHQTWQPASR